MLNSSDLDCALMVSAGRLGRAKDAFDKRDVFRRSMAVRALREVGPCEIAKARGLMQAIVSEVHAAPEHLSGQLYPLAMQAAVTFERLVQKRSAMFSKIDGARAGYGVAQ